MNPPILPWHKLAAYDIIPHAWDWDLDRDEIAAIIARHDPAAAQQEATVRLLEQALGCLDYSDISAVTFADMVRAHLRTLSGEKGST